MVRTTILLLYVLALKGCDAPPDATTPAGAFAMIGPCIDRVDRRCLFRTLERDSRWSIATIHRTLVEIRALVEKFYPESERATAYGTFKDEASASTPEEMFEIFCKKRKCMKEIARGFGAVQSVKTLDSNRVEVTTSRGSAFFMVRADGRWGLDILGEELLRTKVRMIDRLKQVKENARQYEEQRLAREGGKAGAAE